MHLPKTSDSGRDAEAPSLPILAEKLIVTDGHGARTDEAHLALEHVEELGQFVYACLSQELTNACDPRIILDLECRPGHFVQVRQLFLYSLRVGNHGSELVHRELSFV